MFDMLETSIIPECRASLLKRIKENICFAVTVGLLSLLPAFFGCGITNGRRASNQEGLSSIPKKETTNLAEIPIPKHNSSVAVLLIDVEISLQDKNDPLLSGNYARKNLPEEFDHIAKVLEAANSAGALVFEFNYSPRSGSEKTIPELTKFRDNNWVYCLKPTFNAFENTSLQEYLEKAGVKEVIIVGFNEFCCVMVTTENACALFPPGNVFVSPETMFTYPPLPDDLLAKLIYEKEIPEVNVVSLEELLEPLRKQ